MKASPHKSQARVAAGRINGLKGGRPKGNGKGEMLPWRMPRGTVEAIRVVAEARGLSPSLWLIEAIGSAAAAVPRP